MEVDEKKEDDKENNEEKTDELEPNFTAASGSNKEGEDKMEVDEKKDDKKEKMEVDEKKEDDKRDRDKPRQPLLSSYAPYHDGQNQRDFQKEWFKKFPWLEFDEASKSATCFACNRFGKDDTWKFKLWKNTTALKRHAESSCHKDAVTKWVTFLSSRKKNTSVLKQVNNQHVQLVAGNWAYAKSLFESVAFCAKQAIAFQGHEENRENITQLNDKNRGNYLELLSLRSQDSAILKQKLDEPVRNLGKGRGGGHGWLTSPKIQNEMVEILQDAVVKGITDEIIASATEDGEYF